MLGKIILDIAPEDGNPRSSEGAFITLPSGELLFVYSRFTGGKNDDAAADLYAIRSSDGGGSFGSPRRLFTCREDGAKNIMSVTLLPMEDGAAGLFYLIRKNPRQMYLVLRRSYDEGRSWSSPVSCTDENNYYVVNNDRVVRLSSGRLIVPAALHRTDGGKWDSRAEAHFFLSDDDGKSWREADGMVSPPFAPISESGLQEPGALELSPGGIWAWARTDLGRQYEMFSSDGGEHFTAARPSRFTGPCSPLSMKRLSGGELLAVWNPVPIYNGRSEQNASGVWTGARTPLVLAVSTDNGGSFSRPMVIEDDPDRGYCYCAIHDMGGSVMLAYCAGGSEDGSCLSRTRIRKIPKSEILPAAE